MSLGKSRVFVVGPGQYLGPRIAAYLSKHWDVRQLPLEALGQEVLSDSDIVINATFDPALYTSDYLKSLDRDHVAGKSVEESGARYVMLSSRAVYAARLEPPLSESEALEPASIYGRNKKTIEASLREELGDRLLVLRLSNVFGDEPLGRRTFVSTAMTSLMSTGLIELDIAGATRKDFVPLSFVLSAIDVLLRDHQGGVFNIGSGSALPVGTVAEALVRGLGRGSVAFRAEGRLGEEFCLDTRKLEARTNLAIDASEVVSQLERTTREHVR
jgi:nucleoside-diphosphate-sugar epimerase